MGLGLNCYHGFVAHVSQVSGVVAERPKYLFYFVPHSQAGLDRFRGALYCQAIWTGGHHASVSELKEHGVTDGPWQHICHFLFAQARL